MTNINKTIYDLILSEKTVNFKSVNDRGIAQPGSATALGAVGREFESLYPDQFKTVT